MFEISFADEKEKKQKRFLRKNVFNNKSFLQIKIPI